ncbi:MAG: hypothetical protein Q9227_004447 [Pyrenula ochraceoflavens]
MKVEASVRLQAWATVIKVKSHRHKSREARPDILIERNFTPRSDLPLPSQPPYTAHLGNMAFDTTSADVHDFFNDCSVTNVRIVEDKLDHKPKGFGYVEFATLEGLKKALTYSGSSLGGRMVRVSVAEPPKERQESRDFSDWSRKGPLPDLPNQQSRKVSDRPNFDRANLDRANFGRNLDTMSDAGSERGGSRRGYEVEGKPRDFGNWERKGPLSPAAPAPTGLREGGRQRSKDGPQFRRNSPAWGEGRSQDGSRPPRREFQERAPPQTAAELDNQWRSKMRPDMPAKSPTPSRETSTPPSPAAPSAPTSRPKLNLQKRTVSEAEPGLSPAPSTNDSKASPFGAARPVDTASKEKEIEEKHQQVMRQRKEAEEKAKAEKAEEKRVARESKEKAATEKRDNAVETNGEKENGVETQQPGKSFEILRRASEGPNGMIADDEDTENDPEQEGVAEDKAVKPKEIVRDIPGKKAENSWRKPNPNASETPVEETANSLEEEGWSTIPTKQRNNRRSNQQGHTRQRILELENQVKILSGKAAAAADKNADLEDELHMRALHAPNISSNSFATPPPEPQVHDHVPNSGRFSSLTGFLQRRANSSNPPTPGFPPGNLTQASLSTSALVNSADADLPKQLDNERKMRRDAEETLKRTQTELEELTSSLFGQANEMVAAERRARAKLEERVEQLEKRDVEKRRRLERLEIAVKRVERVRNLLGQGAASS